MKNVEPLRKLGRFDSFFCAGFFAKSFGYHAKLFIDTLCDVQEKPLATSHQAMAATVAPQPVLANFVPQPAYGIHCFVQQFDRVHPCRSSELTRAKRNGNRVREDKEIRVGALVISSLACLSSSSARRIDYKGGGFYRRALQFTSQIRRYHAIALSAFAAMS